MTGSGAPLALTTEAFEVQKGWRRREDLVDALPYFDEFEPGQKEAVMKLIEQEARSGDKKPSDYLDQLPPSPPSRIHDHELLQAELKRVASASAPLAALDLERYSLNPPPHSQRSDPAAWQSALNNAHAQLEHQRNRILNLELLLKFGPTIWRAHNEALSSYLALLQKELARTRSEIDNLNKERKLQQLAAGKEITALESEYDVLVRKNGELERICTRIETEIESHS